MKLGEIKLEALRMMRAIRPSELFLENLEFLKESEGCEEYLLGMPGAINRCFSNIEAKGVLAERETVIAQSVECRAQSEKTVRKELYEINDYRELVRIIAIGESFYEPNLSHDRIGEAVVFKIPEGCESISAVYKPRITRVLSYTSEETEIDLPESVACLVPYFLVSELYSEDEPEAAARARDYYEAGLLAQIRPREGIQGKVVTRYGYNEVT